MGPWFVATELPATPASPFPLQIDPPADTGEALEVIRDTLTSLWTALLANLPLIVIGVLILVLGVLAAGWIARTVVRGLGRTNADAMVISLSSRLIRIAVVIAFVLLALSVAGVSVGAALASLGLAGLALAFALQNILENFVSGVLLLIRKPFRAGDQIQVADLEGTVDEIDLRVTKLIDYDGELVLIPNADVFRSTLVNRTKRGVRRTTVTVGIDYRDDQDRAREVMLTTARCASRGWCAPRHRRCCAGPSASRASTSTSATGPTPATPRSSGSVTSCCARSSAPSRPRA